MGCGTSKPAPAPAPKRRVTIVMPAPHRESPDYPTETKEYAEQIDEGNENENENEEEDEPPRPPMMLGGIGREKTGFLDGDSYDYSLTAQAIRLGYPPPIPPSTQKHEVFKLEDYVQVDKQASKVPKEMLYKSFDELTEHLTAKCKTEMEKVRALFVFTTSIDIKNLESSLEKLPEQGTPLDYLLKIQWQLGNHAHFFAQLARSASLPSLIITGVNKSAAYELGCSINHEAMSAQWNVVLVDDEWRLMDVYWASTCVVGKQSSDWMMVDEDGGKPSPGDDKDEEPETMHQINEFFFIPDPEALVCTHLPDEEDWQLLDKPITTEDYEQMVYIRERYHQIGMSFLPESKRMCKLTASNGQCGISFAVPEIYGDELKFRYLLFRSRQLQDNEKQMQVPFERFVFYQRSDNKISYDIQFPVKGKFKLDIFGQVNKKHEALDLACSYLIECNSPLKNINPLPDLPEIGWGPGIEAKEVGLKALTHQDAIIETKDGQVEIRFSREDARDVLHDLKNNELDEWLLKRSALIREEDGDIVINLRLREKGEYALSLLMEGKENEERLTNVCNYLVRALKTNNKLKPFPKVPNGRLGKGNLAKDLGVNAITTDQVISVADGTLDIGFESGDDVELFCELHSNDVDRTVLAECVEKTVTDGKTNFALKLPAAGEFALNVFAKSPKYPSRVCHVHSYKLDNQKAVEGKSAPAPKKAIPMVPLYTSEEHAEIKIPTGDNPIVADFRRKNAKDTLEEDQMVLKKGESNDVLRVCMPHHDDYLLDVYEHRPGDVLVHRCTVHILRNEAFEGETPITSNAGEDMVEQQQAAEPEPEIDAEELQRRMKQKELEAYQAAIREQLKAAIKSQDVSLLIQTIKEFENREIPQQKDELDKAKQLLDYLLISQALNVAMSKRDLISLENALVKANNSQIKRKLNLQMQMATKILEQLRRIEKLKHEVMGLDQKTIAEIKSYSKPPEIVHQVMAATFLLLGSPEKSLTQWKQVQNRIGRTGKESLKRRVQEFNVDQLKIEVSQKTKLALNQFLLPEVHDVSAGAATFYVWSMGMIEECECKFTQEGGDLTSIKVSKPRFHLPQRI